MAGCAGGPGGAVWSAGGGWRRVGAREGVELGGEVGVGGCQVGAGGFERVEEIGRVVLGEGRMELAEWATGGGGQVGQSGDLAGDAAQVGGVAAGPGGGGALGGAMFAGGLDALFAGGSGGPGPTSQVAPFGGLAAGDAEGVGEVGPARSRVAGGFDQAGLPSGELLAYLPQEQEAGEGLFRAEAQVGGVGGFQMGAAQGLVYGFKGRGGGEERRRALGVGAGRGRLVGWGHGTSFNERHRVDDTMFVIHWMTCYNGLSEAHWQQLPEPAGGVFTMLMRTDPFRELDRLTQQLLGPGTWSRPAAMAMDAYREGDEYVVAFDLPGVSAEAIDIDVERNMLTVKAERRPVTKADDVQMELSERPLGVFSRQIVLADTLDTDRIKADYEAGVLTLRIPIAERAKPRKIAIGVGSDRKEISG